MTLNNLVRNRTVHASRTMIQGELPTLLDSSMKPLRFAHLADLHLDTPFKGLGNVMSDLAKKLRDASLEAWDRAVEICQAENVDFVLIAGDVYDNEIAGVRAQLRFLWGVRALSEAGIPTFIVHGNHDPAGGRWSAVPEWPEGVTVFGHDEVETIPVRRDGEVIALVHGISYPERHVAANLARRFQRDPNGLFQIGLLHASVGDHPEHGSYAPCSLEDLRRSGLDYWALGHIHKREVLQDADPTVVYPGNLQARHANEPGAKGFYIVDVPNRAVQPQLTFRPADRWRFDRIEVDLTSTQIDSLPDLHTLLTDQAAALSDEHAGCGLILRAEVRGASTFHAELHRAGTEGLLEVLRDAASPDLWWADLRLATRPAFDRQQRLEAGDFLSDLLQHSDTEAQQADQLVAQLIRELERHPKLTGVARELDLSQLNRIAEELWEEAELSALHLLDEFEAEGA